MEKRPELTFSQLLERAGWSSLMTDENLLEALERVALLGTDRD